MTGLMIEVDEYQQLLDPEFVKDLNCIVTEDELRRPDSEDTTFTSLDDSKEILPEIRISEEGDEFHVINPGPLETLTTRIGYELGEEVELMDFISYFIEHFAQSQVFANGNKRTSVLVGYFILLMYQIRNDFDTISVFTVEDELVELVGKVAIRENDENKDDIREFLKPVEERIIQAS
jgi:prophage maintenance system killer protein